MDNQVRRVYTYPFATGRSGKFACLYVCSQSLWLHHIFRPLSLNGDARAALVLQAYVHDFVKATSSMVELLEVKVKILINLHTKQMSGLSVNLYIDL